jgi:hypothetical protein
VAARRPRLDRWTQISSGLPIGLVLGAAIWVLSGSISGRSEPWDAPGMYYMGALIGSGALGGLLVPGHWIEVAVGIFSGQAAVLVARVLAEPADGGLWPLGILVLGLYTVLALAGAMLGSAVRRLLGRRG